MIIRSLAPLAVLVTLVLSAPTLHADSLDLLWSRQLSVLREHEARGVAADRFGNVTIVGVASTDARLRRLDPRIGRAVVAHYDIDGNVEWMNTDLGRETWNAGLAIDTADHIVVWFDDADVGYLARLDPAGQIVWEKRIGTNHYPIDIDASLSDRIVVALNWDWGPYSDEIYVYDHAGNSLCDYENFQRTFDVRIRDVAVATGGNGIFTIGTRANEGDGVGTNNGSIMFNALDGDCEQVYRNEVGIGGVGDGWALVRLGPFVTSIGNIEIRGDLDIRLASYFHLESSGSVDLRRIWTFNYDDRNETVAATSFNDDDAVVVGTTTSHLDDRPSHAIVGKFSDDHELNWWRVYDDPEGASLRGRDILIYGNSFRIVAMLEREIGGEVGTMFLIYDRFGELLGTHTDMSYVPTAITRGPATQIFTTGHDASGFVTNRYGLTYGGDQTSSAGRSAIGQIESRASNVLVRVELETATQLKVGVYDVNGRLIKRLASGARTAGRHEVTWDGTLTSGARAASGVYFMRFEYSKRVDTRRIIWTR